MSRPIPVYEVLARDIHAAGVRTVFGLMSDDTALFVSALDACGVRFCAARHENMACGMAEGYAASTGQLGIAVLGRGPATANALHGAVFTQRAGSGVLLIFGDDAAQPRPGNGFGPDNKTFDGQAVLRAAGLRTYVAANPEGARQALADAAAATIDGTVALLLPTDVQLRALPAWEPRATPRRPDLQRPPQPPRKPALQIAADVLARSQRPLIIAGLGAHQAGARAAIERLADLTGAVVATSLKAKEMFAGYPYNLGVVGSFSHAAGRRYMEQADCVLAFGAGLNMRTTSLGMALPADAPLIQVDVARDHVARWFHADVALVGDARLAAEALADALQDRVTHARPFHTEETRRRLAEHDWAREFEPAHTARTVDPRSVALALDRLLPKDRNVVYDAGNFFQVAPWLSVPGPAHIKLSVDFASIGMGFGTALGFAVGQPQRPTVLVVGDGGFVMTMGEMETVVREDIPLVIVLMNDCAYGAERHFLQLRDQPVATAQFPDVDYAPLAEALGFRAATIRSMEQLEQLAPLLSRPDGPILLDCKINGAVQAPFFSESLEYERRRRAAAAT